MQDDKAGSPKVGFDSCAACGSTLFSVKFDGFTLSCECGTCGVVFGTDAIVSANAAIARSARSAVVTNVGEFAAVLCPTCAGDGKLSDEPGTFKACHTCAGHGKVLPWSGESKGLTVEVARQIIQNGIDYHDNNESMADAMGMDSSAEYHRAQRLLLQALLDPASARSASRDRSDG